MKDPLKWLLIGLIRGYRLLISPLLGPVCRYYPSCSAYALEAVRRHGSIKGTWLAVRRVLRCHPWAEGGVDHVPPRKVRRSSASGTSSETAPRPAVTAGGARLDQGA